MSEQQLATPEIQQNERLGERRKALRGLAADMLLMLGEAEDRWRSITWQDEASGRSYCLNAGDFTQLQSGERHNDMWLYIMDGDEHDAFCIESEHEFAAPDDMFGDVAEVITQHASQRIYETASQMLKEAPALKVYTSYGEQEQPRQVRLQLDRHAAQIQDFTDAVHEPFIWVRTSDAMARDYEVLSCYDVTSNRVHHTDSRNPYGPVSADAPQEEHVRWLLRLVTNGRAAPSPRGYHMFAAPAPQHIEQPNRELVEGAVERIIARERLADEAISRRQLSQSRADIAGEDADILIGLEASYGLYANTELDGSTVIRTIAELTEFDYSTQAGQTVETAVGILVTNGYMVLETFAVDVAVRSRRIIYVDLFKSQASGMIALGSADGDPLRGDAAVDELHDIVTSIYNGQAGIGTTLRPCPLDIAAGFDSNEIRDSGR